MVPKSIKSRCIYKSLKLECRCILEFGHLGMHNIPNNRLKKDYPDFWELLKNSPYPVVHGDCNHKRLLQLEKGINKYDNPPPAGEKEK